MLKSILVPIDGTEPSNAALTLAICICEGLGSQIEGIGLIERPIIGTPIAALSGDYEYREDGQRKELLKKINERTATLLAGASKRCEDKGVEFSIAEPDGPIQQIVELASESNDLIIIGRTTSFDVNDEQETSDIISHIARNGRRPLIVTPNNLPGGDKIIIGYDGSRSSARTIHMLTLLGLFEGMRAEIISVNANLEKAQMLAARGGAFLERHGISPDPVGIASDADAAEVLLERAEGAGMLVIGAFGHRSIKEFIFGSCTKAILDACPVPVFLYH